MVDNNSADNGVMLNLDVWDAIAGQNPGNIQVARQQWLAPWAYQVFKLPFTLTTADDAVKNLHV